MAKKSVATRSENEIEEGLRQAEADGLVRSRFDKKIGDIVYCLTAKGRRHVEQMLGLALVKKESKDATPKS